MNHTSQDTTAKSRSSLLALSLGALGISLGVCNQGIAQALPATATPTPERLTYAEANARAQDAWRIDLRAGSFDTRQTLGGLDVPQDLMATPGQPGDVVHALVQVPMPVGEAIRKTLTDGGLTLLDYVPNGAFIVRGTQADLAAAGALAPVRFVGPLHPAFRIAPELLTPAGADQELQVVIHGFANEDLTALRTAIEDAGGAGATTRQEYDRPVVRARVTQAQARAIASIERVQWIEPAPRLAHRNDTMTWTVQTGMVDDRKIWNAGLTGNGQVVGHIDGSIATNSCYFADPAGNPIGPNHRKIVFANLLNTDSHGTHTAGTAAGDRFPVNGSTANRGLAYDARIAHTDDRLLNVFSVTASVHSANDAHVHTNSYGNDFTTQYDSFARDVDAFMANNEEDLVLFACTNGPQLRNPENAKNLIAVGASRNGGSAGAFCSGGVGPTNDGRRKPELFAPGCSIVSAGRQNCSTATQTGTSMACPAISAAAMLVRQYFMDGFYPSGSAVVGDRYIPSGALIKAVLINGGIDMPGISGYPSNGEGWGRLILDKSLHLSGDTSRLWATEARQAEGVATGEVAAFEMDVLTSMEPLEITMAFTDRPGALNASNPVINNLDLVVIDPMGTPFFGNVLQGGTSTTGGAADAKNNLERVLFSNPMPGTWRFEVRGTNVPVGPQGFALAANGALSGCFTIAENRAFGTGKAGTLGVPSLLSSTLPRAGSSWSLQLSSALPSGNAFVLFGLFEANIPFDGATLYVASPSILLQPIDASGNAGLTVAIPPLRALCGLNTYWQAVIPNDPMATGLQAALSNALRVRIGN